MSFSSTECTWKDEWAEVRAAREARTFEKKMIKKGQGAGAKAAAAAAALVAAPAKAAAAAAAAEKGAEKAAAKVAAKAAAIVAAEAAAAESAAAAKALALARAEGRLEAVPQYQPGDIEVSGCGEERVNGTYRRGGLRDGVPCYKRVGGGRHKPAFTIERDNGEWSLCVDYGFDSYCYVKARTALPPCDGWANTDLCDAEAPPALSCLRVAGCTLLGTELPTGIRPARKQTEDEEEGEEEEGEEEEVLVVAEDEEVEEAASATNLEQDGGGSSEPAGPPTPAYGGSPSEAGPPTPAYGGTPHDTVVGQLLFAGVKEEASSGTASATAPATGPAADVADVTGATAQAGSPHAIGVGSAAAAETRALGTLDVFGAYVPLPAGATYTGGTTKVLGKGTAVHEVMHGQGAPRRASCSA